MLNLWKNSWKAIVITSIILGMIYIAYDPIKLWAFPPKTIFTEIKTTLYEFKIPKSWNQYSDDKAHVVTYSDLTKTSFITGSLKIYNLGVVMREDTNLNKEACNTEKQQIKDIIDQEKYFELEKIETTFDSDKKACVSKVIIKYLTNEDNFLKKQFHTYFSYQIDNQIIIFELASPNETLSIDLMKIGGSIHIY